MVSNLKVKIFTFAKPDLEYNTGHSVTVKEVNKDLKDAFKEMTAQSGVSHINGLKKDEEGVELAKFKTSVYSNDGVEVFLRWLTQNQKLVMLHLVVISLI